VATRLTKILVLAGLVLAATASSGAAASPARSPILGVVPHAGAARTLGLRTSTRAAGLLDLYLQVSPCTVTCWVMRTNTTYAIYWVPAGYSVQAGYEADINQYLSDVAAASGSQTNVYSVATQYYDKSGWITNQSTFGGSYVATNAFPASGCNDGVNSVCLTDAQLQTEIHSVITANGWPAGKDSLFIIMTPDGVGSCADNSNTQCATNYYCAYHNSFVIGSQPVLYANEPYDATIGNGECASGSSPNGTDADSTINTISHEMNEAITDPWGNAWQNSNGDEIADICAWKFGSPLGGTPNVDAYNQVINGHHYWLQEEYSNHGSTCRQHYIGKPVNTVRPGLSGVARRGRSLTATTGSWTQIPTSYAIQWLRCTATGGSCVAIAGATHTSYRLTKRDAGHRLRVRVKAVNSAGSGTATARASSRVSA
jgi:hypothetical protein